MNPRFPIYIPTKGRFDSMLTIRALDTIGVPYVAVVEDREREAYARSGVPEDRLLVLPFSGRGLVPTRNWIWDHALEEGDEWFWTMDDNIRGFYRLHRNLKTPVADGTILAAVEEMTLRYENVPLAGMNYFMFASRKTVVPPLYINNRVYSNMLIHTDYRDPRGKPYRNEGTFNDDTDLNLRILKDGNCIFLFNAFLIFKETTMTVKGGIAYERNEVKEKDSRWIASEELRLKHPDVTAVTRKFGRWHHHVDYSQWQGPSRRGNWPRLREGVVLSDEPNNFGMVLRIDDPPEKRTKVEVATVIPMAPEGWTPDEIPNLDAVDSIIAFDYETTGLRWWDGDRPVGLAVAWRQGATIESRYLPFAHAGGNLPEERVKEFANDLRRHRLGAHNAKFDHHQGREWGADLIDVPTTDTMHIGALLDDHRFNNKLDTLGLEYLGVGKVRGPSLSQGAGIFHAAQITEYGRRDVELVIRLIEHTKPMIEAQGLERILALESRCLWPVIEMELNAFPIDQELLAEWERSSKTDLMVLEMQLQKVAGFRVNVDSPTDMQRLFEDRGLVNEAKTKAGNVSFAAAALEKFADDEAIGLAIKVGKMTDLRSKSLEAYPRQISSDGLMRFSLNQLRGDQYGTISGRFSASQACNKTDEGTNPQQVMSSKKAKKLYGDKYDIRRLWIPAPGKLLIADDAAQVEFRLFAHYANSAALNARYADDPRVDFHQALTDVAQEFNDTITRDLVKNINFAIMFGAGVAKTAEMLGVSVKESKEFVRQYNAAFPEAKRMRDTATRIAKSRGYVRTILGRRSRFPGGEFTHKALNAVVQGSNGDYQKQKAVELYEAREELGFTMRLTVHDEFVGDVHDEEGAKKVHALLERQTLDVKVPLLWNYGTGANWSESK